MPDIVISTDEKKQETKPVDTAEVEKAIDLAQKRQKLKDENDAFEAELKRKEELMARASLGGRSFAGRAEPNPQDEIDQQARKLVEQFR